MRSRGTKLTDADRFADEEVHERIVFCHVLDMREGAKAKFIQAQMNAAAGKEPEDRTSSEYSITAGKELADEPFEPPSETVTPSHDLQASLQQCFEKPAQPILTRRPFDSAADIEPPMFLT